MKQHTELILSTGTSGFSMPLCYLSMSLLKEMCVCVCVCVFAHMHTHTPKGENQEKVKIRLGFVRSDIFS